MSETTLTAAQRVAYDALLPLLRRDSKTPTAVLEGYAGTGKSFLTAQLLKAVAPTSRIAVAAPTNKAVRVIKSMLSEAGVPIASAGDDDAPPRSRRPAPGLGCTCRSIHSFLGMKLREMENGQQQATKERDSSVRDYEALIVDEASMLSDDLFNRIMAERDECRVLFVGDPAQLPPVQAGGAAVSPVFARVDFKVRLAEVVRQAADNPIIRLSIRLRQLIEAGVKATPEALLDALPPLSDGPKAALVGGTAQTLVHWYLCQRADDPDSDTRVIAYTNDRVQDYNRRIHEAIHGKTATRFVPGERVIVQTQCEALTAEGPFPQTARLITSEELTVEAAEAGERPFYPDVEAERLRLRGDSGARYHVWVAADPVALQQRISEHFVAHRDFKALAERSGDDIERQQLRQLARDESDRGWALNRAFAPLRHAYAITAHKSQGSTFDCALVDFSDLAKMPDPCDFNRALYVAATRSREYLALVVTR